MIKPPDRPGAAPLSAERWAMVRALVEETLTLPREAQPAFLDRSCGDDAALRDQIERLAAAYERADENWGFLAQPAGELVAPLIDADQAAHIDPATRLDEPRPAFCAALADRYAVGAELGRGGMATVYVADDLRNQRRVAIKVLHPDLVVMLGAQRFLTEIRVTANLQHPNLLPLFDSGEAAGLLYYVMPLIEGATLRDRLNREKQLPVDEALRIVRAIASALDYAHRQGVVHRDLKPENILLQDGEPLVADFGIALAVTKAVDTQLTGTEISLGTPKYMSPEQAAGSTALDGRSDIFSLGCVLYELLTGDPPFTGSTAQAVIASVISDEPTSVRTLRPTVPTQVEAALTRALAKSPADRPATAREFADALVLAPAAVPTGARAPPWRSFSRILVAAIAAVALGTGGWIVFSHPPASMLLLQGKLIDHSHRGAVTMTPDGGTLVYTGTGDAGRPIMLRTVGQLQSRAVAGTEGGFLPIVSHDGKRLAFWSLEGVKSVSIEGAAGVGAAKSWRYGNGGWVNDSVIVSEHSARGLVKVVPGGGEPVVLTEPDTLAGQFKHMAALVLPDRRAVVFTAAKMGGVAVVSGELAMASLDAGSGSISPHVRLGLKARRAIAFVNGWLLYISSDGKNIMAVRLDQTHQRISGTPISVLHVETGNLEMASLADNGTLMYTLRPRINSPAFADSNGAVRRGIASAVGSSFMHPRLSPNGKRFVAQLTFERQQDLWLWDIASRTPTRLTTTGTAYHPTWTPDGRRIIYWDAHLGFMSQAVDGGAAAEKIIGIQNVFAPMVTHDGKSVVFMRRSPSRQWVWQIWSASLNGETPPRQVFDEPGDNYMPAISDDGKWLAYVSKEGEGTPQVYVRPYPGPGQAVQVSENGGIEPSWSADGRRIYYLSKTALIQAEVTMPALAITARRHLFDGAFDDHLMPHRNYDVARNGSGFLMIAAPGNSETVVVLNWLTDLRARLKHAG